MEMMSQQSRLELIAGGKSTSDGGTAERSLPLIK